MTRGVFLQLFLCNKEVDKIREMQNSAECFLMTCESWSLVFFLVFFFLPHLNWMHVFDIWSIIHFVSRTTVGGSWTWVKIWIKMSVNRSQRPSMKPTATGMAAPKSTIPKTNSFMWVCMAFFHSAGFFCLFFNDSQLADRGHKSSDSHRIRLYCSGGRGRASFLN